MREWQLHGPCFRCVNLYFFVRMCCDFLHGWLQVQFGAGSEGLVCLIDKGGQFTDLGYGSFKDMVLQRLHTGFIWPQGFFFFFQHIL